MRRSSFRPQRAPFHLATPTTRGRSVGGSAHRRRPASGSEVALSPQNSGSRFLGALGSALSAFRLAEDLVSEQGSRSTNTYECDACGYVYRPVEHKGLDLDEQEDWECPVCQAERDHFHLVVPPDDDLSESDSSEEEPSKATLKGKRLIYANKNDPTIESLKGKYDRKRLDPQPDFQRYQVWSRQKDSRLIESILLDLPIPLFYFSQDKDGRTAVIDGQQRLMAIFDYLNGKYALKGLGPLSDELGGMKFGDLSDELQEHLLGFSLSTVEILRESDDNIKFDLFERLNTGATSLNDQELRNSVYRGAYNEFLKGLAKFEDFRRILKLRAPHKRMADVEYVLRYMAFRDQTYLNHPDKKTKEFLNKQMEVGAGLRKTARDKAGADFMKAIRNSITVYGSDRAFRRFAAGSEEDPAGGRESRINRALMDVQLWGFTRYGRNEVTAKRDGIYEKSIELMAFNEEFSDLIRHTISEKRRVERRFEIWKDMLEQILGKGKRGPRLFPRKKKEELFEKDPSCAICKQLITEIDDAHVDHRLPASKGGMTKDENAALTHRFCNLSKGART